MISIRIQNIIKYIPIVNFISCMFSLIYCVLKYCKEGAKYRILLSFKLCMYALIVYLPYLLLCSLVRVEWILSISYYVTAYIIMFVISQSCINEQKRLKPHIDCKITQGDGSK